MNEQGLKYFDLIERYLDNEMQEDERISFDKELEQNEILKKELEVYQAIVSEVKNGSKRRDLKDKLRDADKDLDQEITLKPHSIKLWQYSIAASILLIIGIGAFYYYYNTGDKYIAIADKYWEHDNGLAVTMGEDKSAFDAIMNAYKLKDYKQCNDLLQESLKQKPYNDTLTYYGAVIEHELNNDEISISEFRKVAALPTSIFKEKSEYRLALLLLKSNKVKEAKSILSAIAQNPNHQYVDQAKSILSEL